MKQNWIIGGALAALLLAVLWAWPSFDPIALLRRLHGA